MKQLVGAVALVVVLTGCGGGPAATVTVTAPAGSSSPAASGSAAPSSTKPSASPSVRTPHPDADTSKPNIGVVPGSLRLTKEFTADKTFGALPLCKGKTWQDLPSLAKRRASQFGSWISESGDSWRQEGVIITTDAAAAQALMAELKAVAEACAAAPIPVGDGNSSVSKVTDLKGVGAEAFTVAREIVKADNSSAGTEGSTLAIGRSGRTIIAMRYGIYFDTPITKPAEAITDDGLAAALKKRLTKALA